MSKTQTKVVRRTCTCGVVYKETVVSDKYFEQLMQNPDVDYSLENDIEYINKTGCCDDCCCGHVDEEEYVKGE